ncbi:MAG: hypothetical protein ABIY35_06940, partial [Chitinophagaceae bacterium]
WGTAFTYTGEIKNGKPDGFGVGVYNNGYTVKYVGQFANGVMSGKGTMIYANGAFLTGDWKDGKMNGKGANVNKEGTFYVGGMKDGLRSGKGWLVLKSNAFYLGDFKNDTYDGMGIYGWGDGRTLAQNIYVDGKREGPGFQYEAKTSQLFQGTWKNNEWESASTTVPFKSFMQVEGFKSDTTTKQILIAALDNNKYASDTSFFYLREKNKRFFGVFDAGYLKSGMQWVDDKSRLIGNFDNDGAEGYCYNFKFNDLYAEGNYTKDYMNGNNCLFIDFVDSSIYQGGMQNGKYTGKAIFVNKNNNIYDGDYMEGKFTGTGRVIKNTGRTLTGTFEDGISVKLTGITLPDGKFINPNPASFSEALNNVVNSYSNYFDDVVGDYQDESDLGSMYEGLLHFPGDSDPFSTSDFLSNDLYQSTLAKNKDEKAAEKLYNDVSKQILATSISGVSTNKLKLSGETVAHKAGEDETTSVYELEKNSNAGYADMKIWLTLKKDTNSNTYTLLIVVGAMDEDSDTTATPYYI